MKEDFDELKTTIETIRKECPWAKELKLEAMGEYLKEEAQEVQDAIEKNDLKNLEEELGDVLFDVLIAIVIAEEKGHFKGINVIKRIKDKLERRHPHVFGELKGKSITKKEIESNWKKIKQQEREGFYDE